MKRFVASAAVVLILDQVTKALARLHLESVSVVELLGSFLRFRLVHNAGAAFGLLQGNRIVFITISIASIGLILYLMLSRRYAFRGSHVAFGMIFAGAIGNLIDRIWLREVVDFIDMGVGTHRWPTYNVADMGVTLGVIYLAISFFLLESRGGDVRGRDG